MFLVEVITSNCSEITMSTKENNSEVAVDKVKDNDKTDAKAEVKGTKRPAEVSLYCNSL